MLHDLDRRGPRRLRLGGAGRERERHAEGEPHGLGEKGHERRHLATRGVDVVEERRRAGVLLAQRDAGDEVRAPEVADERMLLVVAARRTLELRAAELEAGDRLPPARGRRHDAVADPRERVGLGPPHAARHEHAPRLEVEVETGAVDVLARVLVAEMAGGVRLVRALVLGEARVAVDAEQRPADRPRIGHHRAADLAEPRSEVVDEPQQRPA